MKKFIPLVTFLAGICIALALPVVAQNVRSTFPDVADGSYFSYAVRTLNALGVIQGYDNGRFGPMDMLTRAQVAVMLERYDRLMVQPLREQLAEIRAELDLGECGDGEVQTGERCDDGNISPGDGCSASCLVESSRQQTGGCKIAGCSSQLCVEQEDDGISTCEWTEEYACYRDATCERQTDGECGWTQTAQLQRCINNARDNGDSTGSLSCGDLRNEYDEIIAENATCRTDSDCMLFSYSCPFLTCGTGLNKSAETEATSAASAYADCKQNSGEPLPCASCLRMRVSCVNNRCVTSEY